jgi:hypothetical protein
MQRDRVLFVLSVLVVFVSATNITDPTGLGWDVARGIAAVLVLIAAVAVLRTWRREAGQDLGTSAMVLSDPADVP